MGQSEQAIAASFRDAQPGRALLLLDEADSFLHTRADATHGWEVSMVNELLVGLEAYRGLVVCCTNLMPSLDSATLRRFDLIVARHLAREAAASRNDVPCLIFSPTACDRYRRGSWYAANMSSPFKWKDVAS